MKAIILSVIVFGVLFSLDKLRPQRVLYPLARQAAKVKLGYETRQMKVFKTEHFTIKYSDNDKGIVKMVADAAEAAYTPVTTMLGYTPDRALVVIYPDRKELRKAFGWSGNESAMGVYWGGVIQVLSPRDWLKAGESGTDFIHSGPMAHEFTHLVFDYMTNGNYPRWFTEGLAQYLEYRINNYEWITAGNHLDNKLYTMQELYDSFDSLPNEALAYREALAAVRYIAAVYGEAKVQQIIYGLQSGKNIKAVIAEAVNMDYEAYCAKWQEWAKNNMR